MRRAKTLVVSGDEVARCLDTGEVVAAVEAALRSLAGGAAETGAKSLLNVDEGGTTFFAVPGRLAGAGIAGVKWVCTAGGNPARGLPRVRGVILLSDAETGDLLAILDGTEITAVRTGALAAVTARHCARRGAAVAAVVGFGAVGRAALRALCCVLPLQEARVIGRRRDTLRRLAEEASAATGIPIVPAASVEEAVAGADIVVTATGLTADEPIVRKSWVRPGAVVCGLGSYQEVEAALVEAADRLVVDAWDPHAHRGQFGPLVRAGRLTRADVDAELPAIVSGQREGRSSEHEIVVASLLGLGVLDVAVASDVYRKASRQGMGKGVSIG